MSDENAAPDVLDDGGISSEALAEIDANPPHHKRARASKIARAEKMRRAIELRKAGATYRQIADQLGYKTEQGANALVKKAIAESLGEATDELRTLQYERLNHMLLVIWPKVQAGDEIAIGRAQSIMRDMNAMFGVEAPTKVEVENQQNNMIMVIDGDKDQYIQKLREMAGEVEPERARELLHGDDKQDEIIDVEIIEEEEDD